MKLVTRKPTGKAPWPILLLAGIEKAGKSYTAAALSSSDLIDRTFWIEIGEGSADQYGSLPGARYEIVHHDGTFASMLEAVTAAVAEPSKGKPHAIVVDSMTELWALLCNEQEAIRAKRNKNVITMDQWNAAKKRWRQFVDVLRSHNGPVILTARYEQVTVMDKDGKPTKEKAWKVRAEKDLPFEVDGIVVIPKPREFYLQGIRSLKFQIEPGGFMPLPGFTLDAFLRALGIEGDAGVREYTAPTVDQREVEAVADAPDTSEPEPTNDHWDQPVIGGEGV